MNSRERIANLLDRKPVDRIPLGLGASETSGFHLLVYEHLKKILGIASPVNRMSTFMTTALAELEFLEKAECDLVLLNSRLCPSPFWGEDREGAWKEILFWGKDFQVPVSWDFTDQPDGSILWENRKWRCAPGSVYFDAVPEARGSLDFDLDSMSIDSYDPPHELPESYLRMLERQAKWLYDNTPFAIGCGETIQDLQDTLGGQDMWWMYCALEPDNAREFIARSCEASLSQLKQLDQAVGKYCQICYIAHDLGDNRGVTMGPDLWRKVYKPSYDRLFHEWKRITSMKVSLHTCGAVSDILPDLVECGLDILNPVQISARGMEPEELKRRFGNDLIFFGGGYDAIRSAGMITYDEVYEEVVRNIRVFSRGGGYIFTGVHNLPGTVSSVHLKALLDAYYHCRNEV